MTLGALVVERQIATAREVEEGLARQVLFGGDLATNLLEVARVDESKLTTALSEVHGLPPAPAGELPAPTVEARRLCTDAVALAQPMIPLLVEKGTLVVVVAEPIEPAQLKVLSAKLATPIAQRIAPLGRIKQALARHFGATLERRLERLMDRLARNSGPPTAVSLRPSAEDTAPTRPSVASTRPKTAPVPASPPAVADAQAGRVEHRISFRPEALRPQRRRRGPMFIETARRELDAALDRDSIIDLFFDFSRQYFDYTVLFLIQQEIAEGRDAFGDGAARERVVGIGIPLDMPSFLMRALQKREPALLVPAGEGLDAQICRDLELSPRHPLFVVPVIVRTKIVALLVGDGGVSGVSEASQTDVALFGRAVGQAFERLILSRKRGQSSGEPISSQKTVAQAPEPEPVVASRSERAPTQTSQPPTSVSESLRTSDRPLRAEEPEDEGLPLSNRPSEPRQPIHRTAPLPPPVRTSEPNQPVHRTAPLPPPIVKDDESTQPHGPVARRTAPLPPPQLEGRPATEPPAELPRRQTRPLPAPRLDGQELPRTAGGPASASGRQPPGVETTDLRPRTSLTKRSNSFGQDVEEMPRPPRVPSIPAPVSASPVPVAPNVLEIPASAGEHPIVSFPPARTEGLSSTKPPPAPPPSEVVQVVAAHTPPPAARIAVHDLPSIIVDEDGDLEALVERVASGADDDDAEAELLQRGQAAMQAIMARFPGPIRMTPEQFGTSIPRVTDCGPILRIIARQRRVALPFVLGYVADPEHDMRFWATFLLTELAYPEAVKPAVQRLFDRSPFVRRVARAACRALAVASPGPVVAEITAVATRADEDAQMRMHAIDALADLREPTAVPHLIKMLGDVSQEIASVARSALIALTRHDFGGDARKWSDWWTANGQRHRIEWLIDALSLDSAALHRAAAVELFSLSGRAFDYMDNLPKRDRERTQQRYREWWSSEGRVVFALRRS